ncbi:hypothetical protein BT69DRAFT_1288394 [Atractiella rhizophila]|nr:hypothetical protein BT69DRAFT_1288394 [Atractiella rhizophila]
MGRVDIALVHGLGRGIITIAFLLHILTINGETETCTNHPLVLAIHTHPPAIHPSIPPLLVLHTPTPVLLPHLHLMPIRIPMLLRPHP